MNVSAVLTRAAQLHARGDLQGARNEARGALAAAPNDLNVLRFAGVIFAQNGEHAQGAILLRKALDLAPADIQTRINLIQALIDSADLAEAEKIGVGASETVAPNLLRVRAVVARQLGKPNEAVSLLERAASQAPGDWAIWNNLGNALSELDRSQEAVSAFEKAKQLNPGAAIVHLNLGRALASADRHEDSCRAFERAVELDPRDGLAVFEYGKSLLRLGHPERALPLLSGAARIRRTDANIYVLIGLAYARLNDFAQAEQSYRVALHVDPARAAAYLNLAILLERGNRLDELEALQKQAAEHGLSAGEADFVNALVSRRQGQLEDALAQAQKSEPQTLDPALRAQFIGEVADRLGNAELAFDAFSEMNRMMASNPDALQFDGTEYRARIERLIDETTPGWFAGWRSVDPIEEPPSPAFLVGFLRSGTTLLDTILMGHPGTQVVEEEPILAHVEDRLGSRERLGLIEAAEIRTLRSAYFAELKEQPAPGRLLIDKNPLATLRAPIIYRLFPDAPIIFALRHPCDVVLSCFMQSFLVTESMASFLDLENAALVYDRAMTFWKKSREIFPLRVHEIRYEDLVEDMEGEMRPLLAFLGLPWDDKVLDHQSTAVSRGYIRTPSYAQVTEKIYRRASGRWTRYRKHMEPVLPILEPWVKEFGYSLD
jgi:tetratricopeptide (TPR) repeat protein